MKRLTFIFILLVSCAIGAQDLEGSWKLTYVNGQEVKDREVIKIYIDGYFAFGSKRINSNEFLAAGGGEYSTEAGYSEKFDFYTKDSTLVGNTKTYTASISNENLILSDTVGGLTKIWKRISNSMNKLSGNWVITGRERDGELRKSIPGARRTIKILGGDRFQWVAFNSHTGEFFGTGGGTYTAKDGKYIENIDFFSRNNNRVGAKLSFEYTLKNGEWHHFGKSSNGTPIYEIWSPYRNFFDKN